MDEPISMNSPSPHVRGFNPLRALFDKFRLSAAQGTGDRLAGRITGALYWEHIGNRAIRAGNWKLVAKGAHRQDEVDWELYDIESDRSEMHNLAATYPERVAALASQWRAYAQRADVIPWPPKK